MAPDVEAILVNRTELGNEVFLIPIDMCYSLVGELRMYWHGLRRRRRGPRRAGDVHDRPAAAARSRWNDDCRPGAGH
jgi:hypothetical protein